MGECPLLGVKQTSKFKSVMSASDPNRKSGTTILLWRTSALSQFMDQTNPLSEITHKRRLSADVRYEAWHEQKVERTLANYLVGDVDAERSGG